MLHYAYAEQNSHSFILWVNAKSQRLAEDCYIWFLKQLLRVAAEDAPQGQPDYNKIAVELQVQGLLGPGGVLQVSEEDEGQRRRAVEAVKSWIARQADRSWLVVFDEHDALDFQLRDFYPKCSWGRYIITSRRPEVTRYATSDFELRGLGHDDALDLLLTESGRDGNDPQGMPVKLHLSEPSI